MDRIEVSCVIPTRSRMISQLFWNIQQWYEVWRPIESVSVIYDDGRHQEFLMTVWRNNQAENIRTIRFRRDEKVISFFSPLPPPMMSYHRGLWQFTEEPTRCRVTAVREYEVGREREERLADFLARRESFRASFAKRLEAILDMFKQHFAA